LLWDELAACVISCAYLPGDGRRLHAWFAEQVETQPVFYGMEDDPEAFARAVDGLVGGDGLHRAQLEAVIAEAHARVRTWLREGGAADAVARPTHSEGFWELWSHYRAASNPRPVAPR
jgi:hypothetical protein